MQTTDGNGETRMSKPITTFKFKKIKLKRGMNISITHTNYTKYDMYATERHSMEYFGELIKIDDECITLDTVTELMPTRVYIPIEEINMVHIHAMYTKYPILKKIRRAIANSKNKKILTELAKERYALTRYY